MNTACHEKWFSTFAKTYINRDSKAPLELKLDHTQKVMEHASSIAKGENFPFADEKATFLAALYHDVGRFPQYATWHTFKDAVSVNHGQLGAKILKNNELLQQEGKHLCATVRTAVLLHNRYLLPKKLPDPYLRVTRAVRDADKIDIMRIISQELLSEQPSEAVILHVNKQPEAFSPHVVKMILSDAMPNYSDLRYVNDFIMLLCFWPKDLNFGTSLKILLEEDYIFQLLKKIQSVHGLETVCLHIQAMIETQKSNYGLKL